MSTSHITMPPNPLEKWYDGINPLTIKGSIGEPVGLESGYAKRRLRTMARARDLTKELILTLEREEPQYSFKVRSYGTGLVLSDKIAIKHPLLTRIIEVTEQPPRFGIITRKPLEDVAVSIAFQDEGPITKVRFSPRKEYFYEACKDLLRRCAASKEYGRLLLPEKVLNPSSKLSA